MRHVSTVLLDAPLMEEIGRTKNDGNYFGEINGSVWEITARRTED